jgi:lysophospholipase L1-like esterase
VRASLVGLSATGAAQALAACGSGPTISSSRSPEGRVSLAPTDPRLTYVGRWGFGDPARPTAGWQGSSVALRFEGTEVEATLDAGKRREYFRVVVDGDAAGSTRFAASPGVATYRLAAALPPGEHRVELVKETEAGRGFALHGFTVTGRPLAPPPPATRHLEFYGDSGLAGYSLMSERNEDGWDLVGSFNTYAGVTARAFGADYHNISVSGATLASMARDYARRDRHEPSSTWGFARYPADVVVVDLGSNDVYEVPPAEVRRRYVRLLDLLRAAHPEAHIVLFNSYGWSRIEPADYSAEVVVGYGDANVSAAFFPWLFERWHGCESDQGGMARYLIAHLERVTGWRAGEPDLMSGYGWEGGLANGGFEEAAPFGGFGWRYADARGVERVRHAGAAPEGEHFLRLSRRASVHQSNPARGGQEVAVSLWMRGVRAGDDAALTIDFRGQEMGSRPLRSRTQTFALSTEWRRYEISAAAPVVPADPVFQTRLTLSCAHGVAEFDGLKMRTA